MKPLDGAIAGGAPLETRWPITADKSRDRMGSAEKRLASFSAFHFSWGWEIFVVSRSRTTSSPRHLAAQPSRFFEATLRDSSPSLGRRRPGIASRSRDLALIEIALSLASLARCVQIGGVYAPLSWISKRETRLRHHSSTPPLPGSVQPEVSCSLTGAILNTVFIDLVLGNRIERFSLSRCVDSMIRSGSRPWCQHSPPSALFKSRSSRRPTTAMLVD